MATALKRPTDAPALRLSRRPSLFARVRRRLGRSAGGRLRRDPYLVCTAALAPIALLVTLVAHQPRDLPIVAGLSVGFVGLQALLGLIPARRRSIMDLGWSLLRLGVSLAYVASLAQSVGGQAHPMAALYLPVVVAAAAIGTNQAAVIGAIAALIYLSPGALHPGSQPEVALRGLTLACVSIVVAIGTRRLVTALEHSTVRLRSSMVVERRRSRQIAGMEEVSRLLVSASPTRETLDAALGILADQFRYHWVSIYLLHDGVLRLGAQRGYQDPRETFDGSVGVMGQVMRTHELAFVPDVSREPHYIGVDAGVVSEICAPLIDHGEFLGILNVEARQPLDGTDRDLVASLAGRIATVIALGRERQALAERVAVLRSLNEFTRAVSGELDLQRLGAVMVDAVRTVVPADIVTFTALERDTGRYLLSAANDIDRTFIGREIKPGEGLAGRAIQDRTIVVDDAFDGHPFPVTLDQDGEAVPMLGAGIPLIRDGVVVGAISIVRRDRRRAFRALEQEALELLAGHAALAVSNAFLHAEVGRMASHDSLTGLYNRRAFDDALRRVVAAWNRSPVGERRPVSAVMFDLDHFGDFNSAHGHQIGDEVLRMFAKVLAHRFRESDLVARYGGEEFVVILEGATRDEAMRRAEDVRATLSAHPVHGEDGAQLRVTVSAGCAELNEAESTGEQLLRTADVALFMAKRAGRDRVVAA